MHLSNLKAEYFHSISAKTLRCYNGVGNVEKIIVECLEVTNLLNNNTRKYFDDSKYCLKMVADDFVSRSCGIPHLVHQANVTGALIGEINNTCTDTTIATFCLCSTDECNKGITFTSSFLIYALVLVCYLDINQL